MGVELVVHAVACEQIAQFSARLAVDTTRDSSMTGTRSVNVLDRVTDDGLWKPWRDSKTRVWPLPYLPADLVPFKPLLGVTLALAIFLTEGET